MAASEHVEKSKVIRMATLVNLRLKGRDRCRLVVQLTRALSHARNCQALSGRIKATNRSVAVTLPPLIIYDFSLLFLTFQMSIPPHLSSGRWNHDE